MGLGLEDLIRAGKTPQEAARLIQTLLSLPEVRELFDQLAQDDAGRALLAEWQQRWARHGLRAPWSQRLNPPQTSDALARLPQASPAPPAGPSPEELDEMPSEQQSLRAAIVALSRNQRSKARSLLQHVLVANPRNVEAWIWMSKVIDDAQQQRECLERALLLDPGSPVAREELENLRVREMLLTPAALRRETARPGKLGEYLLERGFLNPSQLEVALAEQQALRASLKQEVPLGTILLRHGWVTPSILELVLTNQQRDKLGVLNGQAPQYLGEYLLVERLISVEQLQALLSELELLKRAGHQIRLGELLRRRGILTDQQLEHMLNLQRAEFFSRFGD